MTQLKEIVGFLRTHLGWWCPNCIQESTSIGSLQRTIFLLRQIERAKAIYERAGPTELCEGCGEDRKCIRQL